MIFFFSLTCYCVTVFLVSFLLVNRFTSEILIGMWLEQLFKITFNNFIKACILQSKTGME